jgi:replication factor C subunit 2/4
MDNQNNIWVEKYRPKKLKDIIQQEDIKKMIENIDDIKKLPHMLFYGQPGTGKTTAAINICRHIFGYDSLNGFTKHKTNLFNEQIYKERVLELNASDERGIKVVRDKIKNFAALAINEYNDIPNYKIIILDEADAMTNDSQFALRRIIEEYSSLTRFILICNYVTKIIPPLASRCMKLRFQTISTDSLDLIIKRIGAKENLQVSDNFVTRLNQITKGDLRESINLLERVAFIDTNLSSQTLDEVSGQISEEFINNLWSRLIDESIPVANIIAYAIKFKNSSYSSLNLLEGIFVNIRAGEPFF